MFNCLCKWSGEHFYEARHINTLGDKFVVNLQTKECSCRKWMLTAIPCCHAITCMKYMNLEPADYIPTYFQKEVYEAVYAPLIYPANGEHLWERTPFTDVQPPPHKKMPGRPKKRRIKEPGEMLKDGTELRRHGVPKRCSRCLQYGHNKMTCKVPPPQTDASSVEPNQSAPPTTTIASTQPAQPPTNTAPNQPPPTEPTQPTPPPTATAPTQPTPPPTAPTQQSAPNQTIPPKPTNAGVRNRKKEKQTPASQPTPPASTAPAPSLPIPAAIGRNGGPMAVAIGSQMREKLQPRRAPVWKP